MMWRPLPPERSLLPRLFSLSVLGRAAIVLLLLWGGAFLHFAANLPHEAAAPRQKTDAIVVLTGTGDRIFVGFELLRAGQGDRLLISGVSFNMTKEILQEATGEDGQLMDCCVDLGRTAQNTVGNAVEAAAWAKMHGYRSLTVVTTAYHMPRSLVELRRHMPRTELVAQPTQNRNLPLDGWWTRPSAAIVLAGEFNKYLFSLVRARMESLIVEGN